MKKLLTALIISFGLLAPLSALATTSVPWSITNLTDGFIFPNLINGNAKGILVSASSTINGNLSVSGLTSGNCVQASTGGLLVSASGACGSGSSSTFGTTSISALLPLLWNTTTAQLSTLFSTSTTFGIGNNGFVITGATGIPFTAASSTLNLPNSALQNSSITVNGTGISLGGSGTIQAASSTLLGDTNTFGGHDTFSNTITGSISGSAGSVANALTISAPLTGSSYNGSSGVSIGCTTASNGVAGCLNSTDWATFNGKLSTVTADAPLSGSGTSGSHLVIATAASGVAGALNSTDWATFNNKVSSSSLSVTTIGTSGAATYTPSTGVFNIPQYSGGTTYTGTYPIIVSGTTISSGFGTTTTWGAGNNGLVMTGSTGIPFSQATSSPINLNISGNAGTVTNGVYTTTFNSLFDPRFVTDLAATTSVASITTLPFLSLPASQVAFGTPTAGFVWSYQNGAWGAFATSSSSSGSSFGQDFNFVQGTPNYLTGTTSPLGLIMTASSTIGNGTQAGGLTISGGATTTGNAYFKGNVGIGTTTPDHQLTITNNGAKEQFKLEDTSAAANQHYWTEQSSGGVFTINSATDANATTTALLINQPQTGFFNLFSVASTSPSKSLFAIDSYGHLSASSTAPVLSACGTGSPSLSTDSNDTYGTITAGTVATTCTLTFGTARQTGTHCTVTSQTASIAISYTESLSALVITNAALGGDKVDYSCFGQ